MQDLSDLSEQEIRALLSEAGSELDLRRHDNPVEWFSWHDQQEWLFEAPGIVSGAVRVIIALGGNRGGKTASAKGTLAQVVRRESALNDQLMSFNPMTGEPRQKREDEPLTLWVVPPSFEKARSDWISPADGMGLKYWLGDRFVHHTKSPDQIFYARPPGVSKPPKPIRSMDTDEKDEYLKKCDAIWIKSQDQKLKTFESSECDGVFFDEEPDGEHGKNVVSSCIMRIGTANGFLFFSMTPLNGLSWTYHKWYKPLVVQRRAQRYGERRWIHEPERGRTVIFAQMGTRDNPRARQYADEVEADPEMTDAEKRARLYGEYGFVEGALFPALAGMDLNDPTPEHEPYVVDRLPGDPAPEDSDYRTVNGRIPGNLDNWKFVIDPNKSYGGVLGAMDNDGNLFLVASHLEEEWPDRKHAEAFKAIENKWARAKVQYHHDPGGAGAHSAINLADLGIFSQAIEKPGGSVSASIKRLRGLTHIDSTHTHPTTGNRGAPRVYFYRPGLMESFEEGGIKIKGSRLCEQLSQARQSEKDNAAPDTPHKDIRNKLDLFDCTRYLAMLMKPRSEDTGEKREQYNDWRSLPRDRKIDGRDKDVDLMNRRFYSPSYGAGPH